MVVVVVIYMMEPKIMWFKIVHLEHHLGQFSRVTIEFESHSSLTKFIRYLRPSKSKHSILTNLNHTYTYCGHGFVGLLKSIIC